jgi:hypothetical protein
MAARLVFAVLAFFWLAMNFLLWRAEYGNKPPAFSSVPVEMVWRKILTAPDSSSLSIYRRGKRIGFCHWFTRVTQELANLDESQSPLKPDSMRRAGYQIHLEGNWTMDGKAASSARVESELRMDAGYAWQQWKGRLNVRKISLELQADAVTQSLAISSFGESEKFERTFKFAELTNPEGLLNEFGGPLAAIVGGEAGLSAALIQPQNFPVGLRWIARRDKLTVGHSPIRVYVVETRLLEKYEIRIFVSQVGELLRVELPGEVVLKNDQLNL